MTRTAKGTVFYKMSGSGNDFVMLDGRRSPAEQWTTDRIVALCDRRLGVGADGLVVLTPESRSRVRMDFWNCDGSRADMCGNAALCSTRLAAFLELAPRDGMELATRAGTFPTRCTSAEHEAELFLPDFRMPVAPTGLVGREGELFHLLATVGVPHLVVGVANLATADLMSRGRELRRHQALGEPGANVNFVAAIPDHPDRWAVRTYERGVEGETLACGTGAVACAVAIAMATRAQLPMDLVTRSGRVLHITATLSEQVATGPRLRGEGRLVFTGVL